MCKAVNISAAVAAVAGFKSSDRIVWLLLGKYILPNSNRVMLLSLTRRWLWRLGKFTIVQKYRIVIHSRFTASISIKEKNTSPQTRQEDSFLKKKHFVFSNSIDCKHLIPQSTNVPKRPVSLMNIISMNTIWAVINMTTKIHTTVSMSTTQVYRPQLHVSTKVNIIMLMKSCPLLHVLVDDKFSALLLEPWV